jgi:hypothetical protein
MKMVLKSQGRFVAEKEIQKFPSSAEKAEFRNQHLSEGGLIEFEFSSEEEKERILEHQANSRF